MESCDSVRLSGVVCRRCGAMPEANVFDAYRASKALEGHLRPGDRLQLVAVDDVTGDFWVITGEELVIVGGEAIKWRSDLDRLQGEVATGTGVEVRLRDATTGQLNIAAFRRANKVTERLAALLSGQSD